jgi:hypothetical protein
MYHRQGAALNCIRKICFHGQKLEAPCTDSKLYDTVQRDYLINKPVSHYYITLRTNPHLAVTHQTNYLVSNLQRADKHTSTRTYN